jgi:UPF0716 protein FxsA
MRVRSGWPLALFVVLLVAVPIFEVYVLVQVGQRIGAVPTILILVVEAVLGAWLMRREGTRAWRALNGAFRGGRVPAGELADAALVLVGGVLLMLPGFVTDVLGLFFLVPFTRPFARKVLAFFLARRLSRTGLVPGAHGPYGRGTVVEGEVVPDDGATVTVTPDQIETGRPQA